MLILNLPLPPPLSSYYGVRGKSKYISAKGKAFIEKVTEVVTELNYPTFENKVSIFICIYPADKRISDLDNRLKSCLDALTHAGAWLDDSQVDELCIIRKEPVKGGKCVVIIEDMKK